MEQPNSVAELLDGRDLLRGTVTTGSQTEKYWFEDGPENIAAFLMRFQDADQIVIADPYGSFILSSFGSLVDCCPSGITLNKVMGYLLPMQEGEAAAPEIFCASDNDIAACYAGNSDMDVRYGMEG